MATTSILNPNSLTQRAWPQTVFLIMLENMMLSKFIEPGNDNVIVMDKTLSNRPGDQVIFELDQPLASAGGTDDSNMEGAEESMSFFNFPVFIHERSHAVRSAGKMTDKRSAIKIRTKGAFAIGRWSGEQVENDLVWSLSGLGNQNTYAGEGTSSILTINEKAPSSNRVFFGGQTVAGVVTEETTASAIGDAGSTDPINFLFGTKIISIVKRRAQLAFPKFKPILVGNKWYYVMFIHPLQTKALEEETGAAGWAQIQQNANVRGINNPLFIRGGADNSVGLAGAGKERMFDGAIGVIHDVILFESERLETRVAGEVFDSGDTIDAGIVDGTYRVARALLCGAQAGTLAWGQTWRRLERNFDYFRKPATGTDALYGVSKTQFRDPASGQNTNTAQDDFAVMAVTTAVEEA